MPLNVGGNVISKEMENSYSQIVKNGLVLHLDAGIEQSYSSTLEVEYLIVGGGGGGGGVIGGGGGGGGFLTGTTTISRQSHTITVGDGGSGGFSWHSSNQRGNPGGNSSAFGITAIGGGGGGAHGGNDTRTTGTTGGSGGGAGGASVGSAGTAGQGNSGGGGGGNNGGGGGGAGANGTNGVNGVNGGDGGAGLSSSITGTTVFYAGGGGGGTRNGNGRVGYGGNGGGGSGGLLDLKKDSTDGQPNTGGGGGGGGHNGSSAGAVQSGANGGSGIVVVRYRGPQKASGGTVTQVGDWTIHTFTSSGTLEVGTGWLDLSSNGLVFSSKGTRTPYEIKGGSPSFAFNGSGYWACSSGIDMAGDCTLIMMVYSENLTERDTIFEKAGTSYQSYQQEIAVTYEVSEVLTWYSRYNTYDYGQTTTMDINNWNMMGIKMSSGKVAGVARTGFYSKNGASWVSNYTARSTTAILPAGEIRIGTGYAGPVENGNIAVVMVYERMLSDAEIAQNFNALRNRFGL